MVWVLSLCVLLALHMVNGEEDLSLQTGPLGIIPIHYDLWLIYDLDPNTNFSFFGVVDIRMRVTFPIKLLIFNASHYEIAKDKIRLTLPLNEDTKIWMKFRGEPSIEEALIDIKNMERVDLWTYSLEFGEELQVNKEYSLSIPFYGNLKTNEHVKRGVVCNSYYNRRTRAKEYYLMSDFAPSFSAASAVSSVFPCFTDSTIRTTVTVAIGHPKKYNAISNMPTSMISKDAAIMVFWPWYEIRKVFAKRQSEFIWAYFETTPKIRLYSVGFLLSKFTTNRRESLLHKTKISIWSRPGFVDKTKYAAAIAPEVWTHFAKLFNVSRKHLPKIDFIAIKDYVNIGLGFWGLDFFWEPYLFIQEQDEFYQITYTMSVKVANQFFLHLISMKYMSQSTIAEGCSRFLAEIVTINLLPVYPSIHIDTLFVQRLGKVLKTDALERSRAMTSIFNIHLDYMEYEEAYIYEVYNDKAAILIRMVYMYLGKQAFMEAVRNYFLQYSFNNAEQDDLWRHMQEAGIRYHRLDSLHNETLDHVMVTWTDQPGYPLLHVQRDYKALTFTVTQRRYHDYLTKSDVNNLSRSWEKDYSWWIPISMVSHKSGDNASVSIQWLGAGEGVHKPQLFTHGAPQGEWLLLNSHMIALCRINYDARNWRLLTNFLVDSDYAAIPMVGRVQLLSDAFHLAWTGYLNYTVALELASYLHREDEYQPLQTGLEEFATIGCLLHHTQDYAIYQKYVLGIIDDTYHNVRGLMKTQIYIPNLIKMEQYVSQWACKMNIPLCEESAITQFHKLMATDHPDENNFIPPHLRAAVYCTAVSRGLASYWSFVMERARHERSQDGTALVALACAREPRHLMQALELTVSEDFENKQHIDVLFEHILQSPMGFLVGKSFIYNRINEINAVYINSGRIYPVKVLVEQITTQRDLDEFLAWHSNRSDTDYRGKEKLAIEHGIKRARMNIAWHANHKAHVLKELERLTRPTRPPEMRQRSETLPQVLGNRDFFRTQLASNEDNQQNKNHALSLTPSFIYLLVIQAACMFRNIRL